MPVATTRVTVDRPGVARRPSARRGRGWRSSTASATCRRRSRSLNRVLHIHRIAAADPYVHEVSPAQALVIRAGWGEGEQVADGRWLHARELPGRPAPAAAPAPRAGAATARRRCARRSASPRCSAGAARPLLCEELALRARAGPRPGPPRARRARAATRLRGGRWRAARARAARTWRCASPSSSSCASGVERAGARRATAASERRRGARRGGRSRHALGRLEAALRARTAAGL